MINQNLELKWEYLTIINNQGFWLVSLNEEIYINQIKLDISQKTNSNTFDPNITFKIVDVNKTNILTAFKTNNQTLINISLECDYKDDQWVITVDKSNLLYDGEIIINIQLIKHISEIITETIIKVNDINLHEIEVEWMIKEQYLELSKVNLIIEQIDETHWTFIISEAGILYYGSCTL
ncbi:hypothetical protein [Mesoplasma melaleucae]|uniref:Uncharacterized protein n=1 Tax=Mesoplasma melaleucae TaxID=81459 RepID=A0A2K8NWL0_9MOLU|nr:hypothetical protein [Mesoplasma melaleucae]ATZ18157.1 hypothetical protein EMELA_v1c06500 [Mesoplasma melaleucae]